LKTKQKKKKAADCRRCICFARSLQEMGGGGGLARQIADTKTKISINCSSAFQKSKQESHRLQVTSHNSRENLESKRKRGASHPRYYIKKERHWNQHRGKSRRKRIKNIPKAANALTPASILVRLHHTSLPKKTPSVGH